MKKLSITIICFLFCSLLFSFVPGEAIGASCPYPSCQAANPEGCSCGQVVTVGSALWCCAADSYATNGQWICKQSSSCSVGASRDSISQEGVIENPLGYQNFEDLVNAIINFLWMIGTPLAAIMFVISGIMFVTSTGNPEKVKTAKNVALYTAIGYAIIIMASGLIKVLQSLLQGS